MEVLSQRADFHMGIKHGQLWAEERAEPSELSRFLQLTIPELHEARQAFSLAVDPDALLHDPIEDWFGSTFFSDEYLLGYILGVKESVKRSHATL